MLEEYSAGKVLMIQTGRKRRAKQIAKARKHPEGGEGSAGEEEEEEEEREEAEEEVEKQFNFASEMAGLVDYHVLTRYCELLTDPEFLEDPMLATYITSFFGRVVNQLKSEWVFFQADYLNTFNYVFQRPEMMGNARFAPLIETLKKIVARFFEAVKTNPLLITEALFRFPNRSHADEVLNNYEGAAVFSGAHCVGEAERHWWGKGRGGPGGRAWG